VSKAAVVSRFMILAQSHAGTLPISFGTSYTSVASLSLTWSCARGRSDQSAISVA
jgi:hypothetical protein